MLTAFCVQACQCQLRQNKIGVRLNNGAVACEGSFIIAAGLLRRGQQQAQGSAAGKYVQGVFQCSGCCRVVTHLPQVFRTQQQEQWMLRPFLQGLVEQLQRLAVVALVKGEVGEGQGRRQIGVLQVVR